MTGIKERGQFTLANGQTLADGINTDAATLARFSGLSEQAVAGVLAGKTSTWVRCAKVTRALSALGASDASEDAISRKET
ncbi:hypothetical protein [Roseospira visakhapatnamensis]|uniref:Uncharacterized protein n=1 Tax=Roseospira visakhapatnamensis TaxID=390880 RepID=A0A7W6W9U8_9PROT|nr:hypothetical protein [Roseospira visakhapatnamensis]MBB4266178.1 hypothetical protein [Roseospira visakhapatnamensis]